MKILLVYAHPEPTSFNHALKEIAVSTFENNSYEVKISEDENERKKYLLDYQEHLLKNIIPLRGLNQDSESK